MALPGYDPIDVLMEEHRIFLIRLERFSLELQSVLGRDSIPPAVVRRVVEFGEFLERDVDGWHGQKEEKALFPTLKRHLSPNAGPIGVLLEEHERLRQDQGVLHRCASYLDRDPAAPEVLAEVRAAEHRVRNLLTDHIEKEDRVLFPMAREMLTAREWDEVAVLCREIDSRRGTGGIQ